MEDLPFNLLEINVCEKTTPCATRPLLRPSGKRERPLGGGLRQPGLPAQRGRLKRLARLVSTGRIGVFLGCAHCWFPQLSVVENGIN